MPPNMQAFGRMGLSRTAAQYGIAAELLPSSTCGMTSNCSDPLAPLLAVPLRASDGILPIRCGSSHKLTETPGDAKSALPPPLLSTPPGHGT